MNPDFDIFSRTLLSSSSLIFFLVLIIPGISFSQNRQNKYYNPIRISVSALTKFVIGSNDHPTDNYQFDQGIGAVGEIIYTIDQMAKYEISLEAGFLSTFSNSDNINGDKYLIPISLNAYYYFFDETFSPFIGIGFGLENFNNSSKYVLKPTIGISNEKLKIFGKELINLWELRKRISTVNNDIKNRINPNLQVFDLILSGLYGRYCYVQNKSERDSYKVEKIMKKMNISNLSKKYFSYLSDGEKKISLIARALIKKPDILILDEPIANLDYKSKFFVVDKINELSKLNTRIFCVTHDISMITRIYDRVLMLKDGKIIADGHQNKVINSENLNKLYGIDVEVAKNNGLWNINRLSK